MHVRRPRPRLAPLLLSGLLGCGLWAGLAGAQTSPSGESADPDQPPPLILEDPPLPLVPKQPRTEADENRLEALSLFAAARAYEQAEQYADALRLYQQALRLDPEAPAIVDGVISASIGLGRHAMAVRYMLKAAEMGESDPWQLQRLADYLSQQGDVGGALRLYTKAIAAREGSEEKTADDLRLLMAAGRLYHLVGEYGKAADCFIRATYALDHPREYGLDEPSSNQALRSAGLTYSLFGESYLLADRLDEAAAAFEKAHELAPNEGLLQFNHARLHLRRDEPQKAIASLEACFERHVADEGTAPFQLLAEALEALGKAGELIERLETLRADDPENLPLGYFLAEQYKNAEQYDKAEPLYQTLVADAPTATGYRRLAEIYAKTGRSEELLGLLRVVMETTGLLETLGGQIQAISGNAELMQSLIESARREHENQPEETDRDTWYAMALLCLDAKQFDTAAEFFELVLEAEPERTADVLIVWGFGLLLEDQSAGAAEVFQRAADDPALAEDAAELNYLLAGALAMEDRTEEALAAARKAVELEEDMPLFESRVAWVLYQGRRYDEATEAYGRLIEHYDSDHDADETRRVLREARLVLSSLCVIEDDLAAAEEWLQQVLDEFPDDAGASNDLGYLWADRGIHLDRALKMIQHAVDTEPDNAAYIDSLGWVYYRLERYDEALAELEKAVAAEDDPDPVILDHLGDAHRKLGQLEEARQAWRRAVEAFEKREDPDEVKRVQQKIDANP